MVISLADTERTKTGTIDINNTAHNAVSNKRGGKLCINWMGYMKVVGNNNITESGIYLIVEWQTEAVKNSTQNLCGAHRYGLAAV